MHREDQVVIVGALEAGQAGVREGVPEAGMPLVGGCAFFVSST